MKILGIYFLLSILAAGLVSAQGPGVIEEVTGKVEVQAPSGSWVPAAVGMSVSRGTTISTGFGSRALIDLGHALLNVQPLTRLRLEELIEKEGTVQTDLFLRVGKVNTEVKSAAGLKQDFKLRSPVSTAAVRGTRFEYDGFDVVVIDGQVLYRNLLGQGRTYGPGEGGGSEGYGTPQSGGESKNNDSAVNPYTPGAGGDSASRLPGGAGLDASGSITVIVPVID